MQTARDWLADRNLAKRGTRGKFSNAAKEALTKALADGTKFSDYPKSDTQVVTTSSDNTTTKVTVRATGASNAIVEPAPQVWPDGTRAFARVDGKRVYTSMRNCCFNCRVSLYWCSCGTPRAIVGNGGYVPVVLEA